MNPIKSKTLIESISKELGIDSSIVQTIIYEYYREIRELLSNSDNIRINVRKLGVFYVKPWALKKYIEKEKILIDYHKEKETIKNYAIMKYKQDRLDHMLRLEKKIEEENLNKQFIRNERYLDSDMEE